jgi:catechol 2,3-dioxygenase-like lactoylglutathione lyase family enzyme
MPIGTTKLCHIAIVVKDIEKAADNWARLLGVEKPKIWSIPDEVPTFTDGSLEDYTDCRFGVFVLDNVNIELIQPGEKPSPWRDVLEKNGEGLQNLAFIVPNRKEAMRTLSEHGAPKPFHICYRPGVTYTFTDSAELLGVGLGIKTDDDNTEIIKRLKSEPDLHKNDLIP